MGAATAAAAAKTRAAIKRHRIGVDSRYGK
jgi:hypothetical protein